MKQSKPKPNQYSTFEDALKKVLTVSHAEMKAKLEAEKKIKKNPKRK
jgi:hypothetical protein